MKNKELNSNKKLKMIYIVIPTYNQKKYSLSRLKDYFFDIRDYNNLKTLFWSSYSASKNIDRLG